MSKSLFLLVALFIGTAELSAQCQISGNLIDSGEEAIAYGNILIQGVDNQIKVGALTDDKGYFCLKNIRKGAYKLTASMLGFETYSTQVSLTDDDVNVTLPDILLLTSNTNLAEVIVTGTAHVSQIKPS